MSGSAALSEFALELRGVTKRFVGTLALDNVDLTLKRGKIHALLGENGAGKSTLIKIITGAIAPDGGEVRVNAEGVSFATPRDATAAGITALPQDVVVVPQLSVGRNVLLGLEGPRARVDTLSRSEFARVQRALREVGAQFSPAIIAGELSAPELRLVQIARTMVHTGDIIVMDEPTAVLSEPEAERLLTHLMEFRNHGKAILYVTHRLSEVMRIADCATILRDGRNVGMLERENFNRDRIVSLMMAPETGARERIAGAAPNDMTPAASPAAAARMLEVTNLNVANRFSDVSFSAAGGQIIGIAGIQGSGHADILRALAGVVPWVSGEVKIGGHSLPPGMIRAAFDAGMILIPADRRRSAMLEKMPVQENLAISRRVRRSCRRFGFRFLSQERKMSAHYIHMLSISPPRSHALAGELSGGNQQKVALGRLLESNARILLMDEPTQGIDVRSKAEIHQLLRTAAKQGRTIIIASSEFEELIGLAHIIHVMRLGKVQRTFSAGSATYRELLHCALP